MYLWHLKGRGGGDVELKHCIQPDTKCSHLLFQARPFLLSFYLALFFQRKILLQNRNPDLFWNLTKKPLLHFSWLRIIIKCDQHLPIGLISLFCPKSAVASSWSLSVTLFFFWSFFLSFFFFFLVSKLILSTFHPALPLGCHYPNGEPTSLIRYNVAVLWHGEPYWHFMFISQKKVVHRTQCQRILFPLTLFKGQKLPRFVLVWQWLW